MLINISKLPGFNSESFFKVKFTDVPTFSSLSILSFPLWLAIISSTIERPNPFPFIFWLPFPL